MKKNFYSSAHTISLIHCHQIEPGWIGMSAKVEAFIEKDSYSKVTATGRRRYETKWRAFGALVRHNYGKLKLYLLPAH